MGCKKYELLKDTPCSNAGRIFISSYGYIFAPEEDSDNLDTCDYECFSEENVLDTEWFRPVEENEGEEELPEKPLPAKLVKSYIEGVLDEALDRGIEYAIKEGNDKTYISETRISFNAVECVLQAMKGEK